MVDVPYNDDPAKVELMPGAAEALDRARRDGLRIGLITNQSGVAKGLISSDRLAAVNARVEELVGPFDVVLACTHDEGAGCPCRKPEPGMLLAAADALAVDPSACVMVGDTWSDLDAAERAGAVGILVAAGDQVPHELGQTASGAAVVRPDLPSAIDLVLSWRSA